MNLIEQLAEHARLIPERVALESSGEPMHYRELATAIDELAARLRAQKVSVLGVALDNGPDWALIDLAALAADVCVVPLPRFFSAQQVRHALQQTGTQAVLSDDPESFAIAAGDTLRACSDWSLRGKTLSWFDTVYRTPRVPRGIAKVTYTSGTTGDPKGIILAWAQIESVVRSLAEAAGIRPEDRHLALNPLAVLLENIGGVYVPLWTGGTAVLPSLALTGLRGASGVDARRMTTALAEARAQSAIFMPQTLLGVIEVLEATCTTLPELRFAAVGGAPVSTRLLARAQAVGVPVFEGYGLSECASVITLNTPAARRSGSVGRPLPHVRLRIADDGEIQVGNRAHGGYLGGEPMPDAGEGWWSTGDLGQLDSDGFLYLKGRRRNCFITAFGRNIAPEWVEKELTLEPAIAQAAVFGEAQAFNVAVLVPVPGADSGQICNAVVHANAGLPDYARVDRWLLADRAFTPANGLLTGTGRVRREAVHGAYRNAIDSLYEQETTA